jgi:hypothetical protein
MSKVVSLLMIAFLLFGCYVIYDNLNNDFSESEGKIEFAKETGKWIFDVGKATKNTVGYAIKQDWLPDVNSTNITEVE